MPAPPKLKSRRPLDRERLANRLVCCFGVMKGKGGLWANGGLPFASGIGVVVVVVVVVAVIVVGGREVQSAAFGKVSVSHRGVNLRFPVTLGAASAVHPLHSTRVLASGVWCGHLCFLLTISVKEVWAIFYFFIYFLFFPPTSTEAGESLPSEEEALHTRSSRLSKK